LPGPAAGMGIQTSYRGGKDGFRKTKEWKD
jgi:hypothetical protein